MASATGYVAVLILPGPRFISSAMCGSRRYAEAYLAWVRRHIAFHGMRHPKDLNRSDLEAFLTHLASHRHVSASTQNQALSAVLFLYRKVLGDDAQWIETPGRELFFYQGHSIPKIREILNYQSENSVSVQKSRCLKSLRDILETY